MRRNGKDRATRLPNAETPGLRPPPSHAFPLHDSNVCAFFCTVTVTMDPDSPTPIDAQPSVFRWILGFLMVGACWGLTTPFMRKAAM